MKKHPKLIIFLCIVFIGICAALYVYIYTIPEISGALTPTTVLQHGTIQITEEAPCIVVRDEFVTRATNSGSISYYVAENTKTRRGVKILDVYSGKPSSYNCGQTCVVSYFVDGLEEKLTPGAIADIFPEDYILGEEDEPVVPESIISEKVSSGDPLYKSITSDVWYTLAFVPKADRDLYVEGNSVTLDFGDGTVKAVIDRIIEPFRIEDIEEDIPEEESEQSEKTATDAAVEAPAEDAELLQQPEEGEAESEENPEPETEPGFRRVESDYLTVVIATGKYYQNYDRLRQTNVSIVLKEGSGIIVPKSAMGMQDGFPGVYVKGIDGEYKFTRVKILIEHGDEYLVSSGSFNELKDDGTTERILTVNVYDEVLKDAPEKYVPEEEEITEELI